MRLQPHKVEDRSTFLGHIGRFFTNIAELGTGLDAIYFAVSLLLGLGFLSYIGFVWLLHLFQKGQFLLASLVALGFTAIGIAAIAKSYFRLTLLLGAAAVCLIVFLSGVDNVLLV